MADDDFDDVGTAGIDDRGFADDGEGPAKPPCDGVSRCTEAAVWTFPAAHGGWVAATVAIALWSIAIYARYRDDYSNCEQERLPVYFLVAGVVALAEMPFLWCAEILRQNRELVLMENNLRRQLNEHSPHPSSAHVVMGIIAVVLQVFRVTWWIAGNVWVWRADTEEAACGDLAKQGRAVLVAGYATNAAVAFFVAYRVSAVMKVAIVHIITAVVSVALFALLCAALADGMSVVHLKHTSRLPALNVSIPVSAPPISTSLAGLVGYPYGVGALMDSRGQWWGEGTRIDHSSVAETLEAKVGNFRGGHVLEVLRCGKHQELGQGVAALGFVLCVGCFLAAALNVLLRERIAHEVEGAVKAGRSEALRGLFGCGQGSPARVALWALQALLTAGFVVALAMGASLYSGEYDCRNPYIPRLRLSDHFDLTYGVPLFAAGAGACLLSQALFFFDRNTALAETGPSADTYTYVWKDNDNGWPEMAPASKAHSAAALSTAVLIGLLGAVLADGRSLVTLKSSPPMAVPSLNATLRTVLGYPYGAGALYDSRGWRWTQGHAADSASLDTAPKKLANFMASHPFEALECRDHQTHGEATAALAIIALLACMLAVACHLLARMGNLLFLAPGAVATGIQGLLVVGFVMVIAFAAALYDREFDCDSSLLPKLKLADHFDLNYGIGFLVIGFFVALVNFLLSYYVTCVAKYETTPKYDDTEMESRHKDRSVHMSPM